jgi:hypothetical protein
LHRAAAAGADQADADLVAARRPRAGDVACAAASAPAATDADLMNVRRVTVPAMVPDVGSGPVP